ncbi:hypothetical protein A2U01_0092588, partial [Trifolium medium]|nr:hypothetical protein [Trifolium medium]
IDVAGGDPLQYDCSGGGVVPADTPTLKSVFA